MSVLPDSQAWRKPKERREAVEVFDEQLGADQRRDVVERGVRPGDHRADPAQVGLADAVGLVDVEASTLLPFTHRPP